MGGVFLTGLICIGNLGHFINKYGYDDYEHHFSDFSEDLYTPRLNLSNNPNLNFKLMWKGGKINE